MNNLDLEYQKLLQEIILDGKEKTDRTGTGTKSIFGKQIRHKMSEGFPLLTTKKMAIKSIMTELKWFLKGDTNIKYLVNNGCNIWNGDAYKQYQRACMYELDRDELTLKEFVDKIKKEFCLENGINFEVIKYDEDINTRLVKIIKNYS